jgi:hypothetical protein
MKLKAGDVVVWRSFLWDLDSRITGRLTTDAPWGIGIVLEVRKNDVIVVADDEKIIPDFRSIEDGTMIFENYSLEWIGRL